MSAGKQVVDTDFAAALRGDGGGGSDTDSSDESGDRYKTRLFFSTPAAKKTQLLGEFFIRNSKGCSKNQNSTVRTNLKYTEDVLWTLVTFGFAPIKPSLLVRQEKLVECCTS